MADVLGKLKGAILEFDEDAALEAAKEAVAEGVDPVKAIGALAEGLNELGEAFEKMEVFLPEIMLASDAFKAALEILEPELKKTHKEGEKAIPVVIGTIGFRRTRCDSVSVCFSACGSSSADFFSSAGFFSCASFFRALSKASFVST